MSKNLKFFVLAFAISLPFWYGMNALGDSATNFFYWQEISKNPEFFTAQLIPLPQIKPSQIQEAESLEINAKSVISVFLNNKGNEELLFEKDIEKKLPIASLTKLMTAHVVLKYYDIDKGIQISETAVGQEEDLGKLIPGKFFPVSYLLYPLLIESSNDAAYALANDYNGMTEKGFVELMNSEVERLGLEDTFFVNPAGLDPLDSKMTANYSTVSDLVKLTEELLREKIIWEILSIPKYETYGPELINTNKLLGEIPEIVGGKTGYTDRAGGCMVLVLKAPRDAGYIVNVILGTYDRFGEMKNLVNWINQNYSW